MWYLRDAVAGAARRRGRRDAEPSLGRQDQFPTRACEAFGADQAMGRRRHPVGGFARRVDHGRHARRASPAARAPCIAGGTWEVPSLQESVQTSDGACSPSRRWPGTPGAPGRMAAAPTTASSPASSILRRSWTAGARLRRPISTSPAVARLYLAARGADRRLDQGRAGGHRGRLCRRASRASGLPTRIKFLDWMLAVGGRHRHRIGHRRRRRRRARRPRHAAQIRADRRSTPGRRPTAAVAASPRTEASPAGIGAPKASPAGRRPASATTADRHPMTPRAPTGSFLDRLPPQQLGTSTGPAAAPGARLPWPAEGFGWFGDPGLHQPVRPVRAANTWQLGEPRADGRDDRYRHPAPLCALCREAQTRARHPLSPRSTVNATFTNPVAWAYERDVLVALARLLKGLRRAGARARRRPVRRRPPACSTSRRTTELSAARSRISAAAPADLGIATVYHPHLDTFIETARPARPDDGRARHRAMPASASIPAHLAHDQFRSGRRAATRTYMSRPCRYVHLKDTAGRRRR